VIGLAFSSVSTSLPDHGPEKGLVEFTQPSLAQSLHFSDRSIQIPAELTHIGPSADVRPLPKPSHGSPVDLERAGKVAAPDVKICHSGLQDALIQTSHGAAFIPPSRLQLLMGLEVSPLVEEADPFACAGMQLAVAVCHVGGSITWLQFPPVVKSPRMSRKSFLLLLSLVVVAALIALASSLNHVQFQPGHQLGPASNSTNPIVLPALEVPSSTPLWKILLFWALAVINVIVFFWLLPPEVRKRLLRQVLRFAVGVLALILALRYELIKLPKLGGEPAPGAGPTGATAPGGTGFSDFHPPQMSPWMVYVASLAAILFLLVVGLLIYRRWFGSRPGRPSPLNTIADIAQLSLHDLAAGRSWGDVIIECYARMSEAVSSRRGLVRQTSATPREFADRLTRAGLPADAVSRLTRLFESVRYGSRTGSEADIRDASDCLNAILRACGTGA
jgi:hypothetical protein